MVDLDEEVSVEDLTFAFHQLIQTNKRIADVKTDLYLGQDFDSPHDISPEDIAEQSLTLTPHVTISDCQICVELCAKAIFKSLGINPVESHDITFGHQRVSGLLSRVLDERDLSEKVPRVIFLTQFWERFYTLSKYGIPEENISSSQIMNKSDAIRAVQDADYCHGVAEDIHEYVLEQKGMEQSDLDMHLV